MDKPKTKCEFIGRPKHAYPCSACKQKDCYDLHGNIPTTCYDCRFQMLGEKRPNACKHGIRPCKDFEAW